MKPLQTSQIDFRSPCILKHSHALSSDKFRPIKYHRGAPSSGRPAVALSTTADVRDEVHRSSAYCEPFTRAGQKTRFPAGAGEVYFRSIIGSRLSQCAWESCDITLTDCLSAFRVGSSCGIHRYLTFFSQCVNSGRTYWIELSNCRRNLLGLGRKYLYINKWILC